MPNTGAKGLIYKFMLVRGLAQSYQSLHYVLGLRVCDIDLRVDGPNLGCGWAGVVEP